MIFYCVAVKFVLNVDFLLLQKHMKPCVGEKGRERLRTKILFEDGSGVMDGQIRGEHFSYFIFDPSANQCTGHSHILFTTFLFKGI